ncbi:DMT family transporter [Flavivirga spongiicola]|uniref:DMT family transporter n=1 Tax=Flavivirga spongiicola TaxID=421621 RepID=A0ABU7XV73_9FLAO|nr:EamA family transporter [Flavivirga sp. MEBiC05379]MDO5979676.1 EamA family transporter [Flavivirga sp. MEBiC05379]
MKNQHNNHLLLLLLATLFISTSGALGKFIDMPIPVIIWWRSILAFILLYGFCRYKKISLKLKSKKEIFSFIISALFLAAHWITYFYALKLSNVAIGMLSLFVYPIITAFLEPLFIKVKFDPIYILLGLQVLIGIYILAPEFNLESSHVKGLLFGLSSALFYALRNIISKQLISNYNGTSIMLYQIGIISIVLSPILFFMDTSGMSTQFPYVIILAVITTAVGHTMLVNSLKHFTVSTASIISSTQPILGIIIAFIFLNEIPTWNTFFGGLVILSTVIIESIRSKKASS